MIVYQAQADEEWTIDKFRSLSFARVSGEVIHGDNLNSVSYTHLTLPTSDLV